MQESWPGKDRAMYTSINFKTKKALKEAVQAGRVVSVYQSNNMFSTPDPQEGTVTIEGPHFPHLHKWYAKVTLENGRIVKVQ
jgi:hypothetical protein